MWLHAWIMVAEDAQHCCTPCCQSHRAAHVDHGNWQAQINEEESIRSSIKAEAPVRPKILETGTGKVRYIKLYIYINEFWLQWNIEGLGCNKQLLRLFFCYDKQELVLKAEVESQRKEKEKFQAKNLRCEHTLWTHCCCPYEKWTAIFKADRGKKPKKNCLTILIYFD